MKTTPLYNIKKRFIFICMILTCIFSSSCKLVTNIRDTHSEKSTSVGEESQENNSANSRGINILIDPGHGGYDPGKVGINGALEKDINLAISIKLKNKLSQIGFTVKMTRNSDSSLSSNSSFNKKQKDLEERIKMADVFHADLLISIHQNSYAGSGVSGAQVFYYETSESGKDISDSIMNEIKSSVDENNHRLAKGNSDYFILKNAPCTSIIVECGFLSDYEESKNLSTTSYQEKIADAIANAINKYYKRAAI